MFILNLGVLGPFFIPSTFLFSLSILGLNDVAADIGETLEILVNETAEIYFGMMMIFLILLILLMIILLALISIKIIKENRMDKLKIINNLLIITEIFTFGCMVLNYKLLSILDRLPVWEYLTILFLISTVTTGIFAFRRDIRNKKKET